MIFRYCFQNAIALSSYGDRHLGGVIIVIIIVVVVANVMIVIDSKDGLRRTSAKVVYSNNIALLCSLSLLGNSTGNYGHNNDD